MNMRAKQNFKKLFILIVLTLIFLIGVNFRGKKQKGILNNEISTPKTKVRGKRN
jgi:hypothetical protein